MSRPAPATRAVAALTSMELRLMARRGENVLVTLVIPPAILLFFAASNLVPGIAGPPVDYLLPGAMALAVVASGLISLGIATAFERSYGVLKRLGGAPIAPGTVVAAKALGVLAIVALQVVALVAIAGVALGWSPGPGWSPAWAVVALVLGAAAFAGLGLLMAGTLRAEATLALANGLFLGGLMLGGIVLPVDHLPELLQPLAAVLPVTALADLLRVALTGAGDPVRPVLLLGGWAVGAALLAARWFRWE